MTFSNKEFQIGAYSNETVKASIGATTSDKIGLTRFETGHNVRLEDLTIAEKNADAKKNVLSDGKITMTFKNVDGINDVTLEPVQIANITGDPDDANVDIKAGQGLGALMEAINKASDKTGVKASVNATSVFEKPITAGITSESFQINGVTIGSVDVKDKDSNGALRAAINSVKDQTGVEASVDNKGRLVLSNRDGRGIQISESAKVIKDKAKGDTKYGDAAAALGNINAADGTARKINDTDGDLIKQAKSALAVSLGKATNNKTGDVTIGVDKTAGADKAHMQSAAVGDGNTAIWGGTLDAGKAQAGETDPAGTAAASLHDNAANGIVMDGNSYTELKKVHDQANDAYTDMGYLQGLVMVNDFLASDPKATTANLTNGFTFVGITNSLENGADDTMLAAVKDSTADGSKFNGGKDIAAVNLKLTFDNKTNFTEMKNIVQGKIDEVQKYKDAMSADKLKLSKTADTAASAEPNTRIIQSLKADAALAQLNGFMNAVKDMEKKAGENLKQMIGLDDENGTNFGRLSLVSSNGKDIVVEAKDGTGNNMTKALGFDKNVSEKTVSLRETNASIDKETADAMGFNSETWQAGDRGDNTNGYAAGVMTLKGAQAMMNIAETAQKALEAIRSDLGSVQNQLVSTVNNISVTQVNVKAAESNIRDVDFAQESATFSKHQILAQSGVYAMSQANAVQQNVMRLLQ